MPDGAVKRKRKRRPPARKRKPLPPSYFWPERDAARPGNAGSKWPKSFTFSAVRHPILGIRGAKPRIAPSIAQMVAAEAARKRKRKGEAPRARKSDGGTAK
jgi:hypothetical protein